MKKLLLIPGSLLLLATGVTAQVHYHGGRYYFPPPPPPHVSIGIGFGVGPYFPAYPYYGPPPYFAYPPIGFGFNFNGGNHYARPSKLDLQIQAIKDDYNERIDLVKHDKSLKRKERKQLIHELEAERDKDIAKAQKDYYMKPLRRHNFNSGNTENM
ncbi:MULTISPECIES: hypothetical protein [Niastella]|uniref:Uncharacterized protein n=1 Tax=Niastella soli TaxID=2821487 RepID=A0ABS3Z2K6_9BACT|nr:hypothetical protein [Niastella soli]MBO9203636.1 hypothetical protein [Niastella soli]